MAQRWHFPQALSSEQLRLPDPAFQVDAAIVERLLQAKVQVEPLLIWGSCDCDSIVAIALLTKALAGWNTTYFLHRRRHGYGFQNDVLETYQQQGIRLILSVCPSVPVTDLDLEVFTLKPGEILNATGQAYRLVEALYNRLEKPGIETFLDLVAVGLLTDPVSLAGEAHPLAQQGLAALAATNRPSLQALLAQFGEKQPTVRTLANQVLPKLSALGRLENASLAVELLIADDPGALCETFVQLHKTNRDCAEPILLESAQQIESRLEIQKPIVLASADWKPEGLPIAAARLVERFHRPVVLISIHKTTAWGWGMSIPGVNLWEALKAVAPLLEKFSGHAQAICFEVATENLPALRVALSRELAQHTPTPSHELTIAKVVDSSLVLDIAGECDRVYAELAPLEPFGPGRPRPFIAVLNSTPNLQISRDGRHLDCKIGGRTLRLRNQADRREELESYAALDIVFEMEHWVQGKVLWWGRIHDLRPSHHKRSLTKSFELTFLDWRKVETEAAPDLVIRDWPLIPDALASLLRHKKPHTVALAPCAQDWETLENQLLTASPESEMLAAFFTTPPSPATLKTFLREARAFRRWLHEASAEEISQLCQRLIA
jgi:single-stranded DNA-specific DHH superfamily exonuclease